MTPPNPSWRLPVAFPGPHSGLLRQWPTLWVASAPDAAFLRFRECLLAPPNPSWRLPALSLAHALVHALHFVSGRRFGHSLFAVSRMPFDTSKSLVAPSCRFPWPTLWSTSSVARGRRFGWHQLQTQLVCGSKSLVAPSCPFPGPRSGPCSTSSVADALGTACLRFRECLLTPPNHSWRLPVAFPGPHSGLLRQWPVADALGGISSRHSLFAVSRMPFPRGAFLSLSLAHTLVYFVSGRRFGWHQLQTQLVCGFENAFWHLQIPRGAFLPFPWPTLWSMLYTSSVADALGTACLRFRECLLTPPNPSWRLPVAFPGPHSGLLRQWPTLWVASAPDTACLRFRECLLAPPNPSWRLPALSLAHALVHALLRQWPTLWAQLVCGFENAF